MSIKEGAMARVRRLQKEAQTVTNPISKILDTLVPGRKFFASLTVWGLALFFGAEKFTDVACEQGLVSFQNCQWLYTWMQAAGVTLGALGIRRAALKGPSK